MPLDVSAAKAAGYSDKELVDFLGQSSSFDHESARKAGYSDAEILHHFQNAPETPGTLAKAWNYISAPMRGVSRIGEKLDVAAKGTPFELWPNTPTTPEASEAKHKALGSMGTEIAAGGLGKTLLQRALAFGVTSAMQAPEGQQAKEFVKGAATAGVGEGVLKAAPALTSLLPGSSARATKALMKQLAAEPKAGPRAGEDWSKYIPRAGTEIPHPTDPRLVLQDRLTNLGKKAQPSSVGGQAVGATADTTLNMLRRFLERTYNPQANESNQ